MSKLAHCGTGPHKVLPVGPDKVPDGDLVGRNLLLLDTSHEDSRRINARVSVHRCKRCYNPHEGERRPQFLLWAMSSYVLNKYSGLSPPFHLTADDVNMGTDPYRVTIRSIVNHRILRGFSGTVSVQYLTSWNEMEKTSRETEQDLEQYGNGNVVERSGAGEPKQVRRENEKYRAYRVQMANDRKRGQPARYMGRQGTSSVATQDVPPTCAHLTALARTFSSRQLAMGGNLRRWWNAGIYVNGGSVLAAGRRSLFESTQLLGRDSRRAL